MDQKKTKHDLFVALEVLLRHDAILNKHIYTHTHSHTHLRTCGSTSCQLSVVCLSGTKWWHSAYRGSKTKGVGWERQQMTHTHTWTHIHAHACQRGSKRDFEVRVESSPVNVFFLLLPCKRLNLQIRASRTGCNEQNANEKCLLVTLLCVQAKKM